MNGDWQELCVVGAALETGIFRALAAGPRQPGHVAGELGADPRATIIVMEALTDLGYLDKQPGGSYACTPLAAPSLTDPSHPDYRGNSILHSLAQMEKWLTLPQVVRTGEHLVAARSPQSRAHFIGAMREIGTGRAPEMIKECLRLAPGVRSVLDLGGGPGVYAAAFRERDLHVTLQDYAETLDLVRGDAALRGVDLFPGDFHEALAPGPFDLVFLGNITHIYSPERNLDLLGRLTQVLNPEGYLAIADFVRGMSPRAPLFAVNMLVSTAGGSAWTFQEYATWLGEAGFGRPTIVSLQEGEAQLLVSRRL